jgi:hypothetical protein
LQLPEAKLEIGIDLNNLQINTLNPGQSDLFTRPSYPGYPDVNLGDPNLRLAPPSATGRLPQVPPESVRY